MSRITSVLVGAIVLSALTSLAATRATRVRLGSKSAWVEHTAEVKLTIADARLYLEELTPRATEPLGEAVDALSTSTRKLCELTRDNPRQQLRCNALAVRLSELPDKNASSELGSIFREMNADEDVLLGVRRAEVESAQNLASATSMAAIGLGFLFGGLLLWRLRLETQARWSAEKAVRREAALMRAVMDSMGEAIIAVYPNRKYLLFNRAARRLLGADFPDTDLPEDWRSSVEATWEDGTPMPPAEAPLARAMRGELCDKFVYRLRKPSEPADAGTWVSTTTRPVYDDDGNIMAAVAALTDISEIKHRTDLLRSESISDELTRLYNRRGFVTLARQQLEQAARDRRPIAVIFADMNGLKQINDGRGHECGDEALRDLADLLRIEFPRALIARFGGDEFALLLADIDEQAWPLELQRLNDALAERNARGSPFRLSVSTGAAFFDPDRSQSLDQLLETADQNMYKHKRDRRGLSLPVLGPNSDPVAPAAPARRTA